MRPLRVLYVIHGHPRERPGGAEIYTRDLVEAMKARAETQPCLLARTERTPESGPPLWQDTHDPSLYWLSTQSRDFDLFFQQPRSPGRFRHWVERLLRQIQPDVVHLQHTQYLALNLILWIRETLPDTKIVYTLHDFVPLCHRQGMLVHMQTNQPCDGPSPEKCQGCFPDLSTDAFVFRNWHMQSRLKAVDLFIAPSRFLCDRYIQWGIPSDKIVVEEYGRPERPILPPRSTPGPRHRFAFFGQLNPFKGVDLLLQAILLLANNQVKPDELLCEIHGANLDAQHPQFQKHLLTLLQRASATGLMQECGAYTQEDLPHRMSQIDWVIVPSIWWENSPLVIQEAFQNGRPVICSDIGGMAEKVTPMRDGLHFRAADPTALAQRLLEAARTPGLWERLRAGIRPVSPLRDHCDRLIQLYTELLKCRNTASADASRPDLTRKSR